MASSFGKIFSITTFGESHGPAIGAVIEGCPAGLSIDVADIQEDLDLRRPGQSRITTQRREADEVEILSGVFEGKSTGTPIALLIRNKDQRPADYTHNKDIYRPGHADITYDLKYGARDHRGGGRSSARETAARVAAGAVARKFLKHHQIEVFAYVEAVGPLRSRQLPQGSIESLRLSREDNLVRAIDGDMKEDFLQLIETTRKNGDTVGGRIACVIRGCPAGLGEPVFDKLHADLAKAMLSINAVHAFEYGSGFEGTEMTGSAHNDLLRPGSPDMVRSDTNNAGGILGGISTGQEIKFNVGFKPVATIMKAQDTVNSGGSAESIQGKGRHDPCVLPRAVVIVEAMAALVLADHLLRHRSSRI